MKIFLEIWVKVLNSAGGWFPLDEYRFERLMYYMSFIIESINYIAESIAEEWEWAKSILTDEITSRFDDRIFSKNPNCMINIYLRSVIFLLSSYFSLSDKIKLKALM